MESFFPQTLIMTCSSHYIGFVACSKGHRSYELCHSAAFYHLARRCFAHLWPLNRLEMVDMVFIHHCFIMEKILE